MLLKKPFILVLLVGSMMDDPTCEAKYIEFLRATLTDVFVPDELADTIDAGLN